MPTPSITATRVDVGSWTLKNPDGCTEHFTYDILKRRYKEREHNCLTYARAKLRCWDRSIDQAVLQRDVVTHQILLPPKASDLYLNPHSLWTALDEETDWDGEPHMMAGMTIWFPDLRSQHWAIRQAAAFAQIELADVHGVGVHLVAHAPGRIAQKADFHIHLLCTARTMTNSGFDAFAQNLLFDGCQSRSKAGWDAWWKANPES